MTAPDGGAPEACLRCEAPIRWIDAWFGCPEGCAYCSECADETGGACVNGCGGLTRTASQARALPGSSPPLRRV